MTDGSASSWQWCTGWKPGEERRRISERTARQTCYYNRTRRLRLRSAHVQLQGCIMWEEEILLDKLCIVLKCHTDDKVNKTGQKTRKIKSSFSCKRVKKKKLTGFCSFKESDWTSLISWRMAGWSWSVNEAAEARTNSARKELNIQSCRIKTCSREEEHEEEFFTSADKRHEKKRREASSC